MKDPDAIHVTIDVQLDWIEPPENEDERIKRAVAQRFMKSQAAEASTAINNIIADILERR